MRNYRFTLSSMIPIAWLYKLKHMNNKRNNNNNTTTKRNQNIITSPSSSSSSSSPPNQTSILPRRPSSYLSTRLQSQNNNLPNSLHTPSPLDPPKKSKRRSRRNMGIDQSSLNSNKVFHATDVSNLQLPPVATKSTVNNKVHRRKVHIKSPRLSVCTTARKSLAMAQSFAIIKSSSNPQKDFEDSMMEMIVENNIRSPGLLRNS